MRPLSPIALIAPCGMNCALCAAYQRERNRCPGCRAPDPDKPKTRVVCRIKTCAFFIRGKKKYCHQCGEYPCKALLHLDKRYRTRYAMSMIENLASIKASGVRRFVRDEKARWACPKCGGIVCVHKGRCLRCAGGGIK